MPGFDDFCSGLSIAYDFSIIPGILEQGAVAHLDLLYMEARLVYFLETAEACLWDGRLG